MFNGKRFFGEVAQLGVLGAAGFGAARYFEIQDGYRTLDELMESSILGRDYYFKQGYSIPFFNEASRLDDYAVWSALVVLVALLARGAFRDGGGEGRQTRK